MPICKCQKKGTSKNGDHFVDGINLSCIIRLIKIGLLLLVTLVPIQEYLFSYKKFRGLLGPDF